MDCDQVYVRPAELSSLPSNSVSKDQAILHVDHVWNGDEKFVRYDSSPESMVSYNDDNTFSLVDTAASSVSRTLLTNIKQQLFPYQDQAGDLSSFPFPLGTLEESLLTTYLNGHSENLYGFNPDLSPHPAATVVAISISNPALFHIVLALSAQYRLISNQFQSLKQQRDLECMVMIHKGEAMQLVQRLSSQAGGETQNEDLMVSIVGFGMLDRYCQDADTAAVHFSAGRNLLRSMGGPLQIQNILLSRSIAHFECGYGSSTTESFVWDRSDFGSLHMELNRFFTNLWTFQAPPPPKRHSLRRGSTSSLDSQSPHDQGSFAGLRFDTVLYDCLSRKPEDASNPSKHDQREMIFQLNCLLTLSTLMVDYWTDPQGFQSYMDSVHELVAASQTRDQPINNIMWLLQINDHSHAHSRRVWTAAGWTWVLRHVNYNVQTMVKGWLITILTGRPVSRALKLDSFAFSYAS